MSNQVYSSTDFHKQNNISITSATTASFVRAQFTDMNRNTVNKSREM